MLEILTVEIIIFIDGRRPVYLSALPLLCIGSFGTALSKNVSHLMIWRFVQAFGASPALSVGVASIGDLYHIEQRGAVVGMFFSVCYLL